MPSYSLQVIADIVGGTMSRQDPDVQIEHLLTDSRKLVFPSNSLFFALVTGRRNGHRFLDELYNRELKYYVVSQPVHTEEFPGAVFITVKDTLLALQQLAAWQRHQFDIPVIGITGSNGKTIVKEWLNHLMEHNHRIIRSPKSYNSQTGVPLSVWPISAEDELGIFEAGISEPGEMARLEPIIRPTIGIITNIGEAHDEGFKNKEEKLREKMILFHHSDLIIYCRDHQLIQQYLSENPGSSKRRLFSWGKTNEADLQVIDISYRAGSTEISAVRRGKEINIIIPFADEASVENALHCWCVMISFGYSQEEISSRMTNLPVVAMRLELKKGINGCSLINDIYNADWSSLKIALDFLARQQQGIAKTVILSDFVQSGTADSTLYPDIAQLLKNTGVTRLIGIGPAISRSQQVFLSSGLSCTVYLSTEAFLEQFHPSQFRDETILLKGARSFEFERVGQLLEKQSHQTVLEINLGYVTHNLKRYQQILLPHTKLMVMVKAFSYGTGSFEIANLLQFHRVDFLAVAYADEGVELRKAGISLPILVMNTDDEAFGALTGYDLQPELFSFGMMRSLDTFLKSEGITDFPVHIKLDTGMHRLGFMPDEIEKLAKFLANNRSFRVQSVFSHLVGGEDPAEDDFTRSQAKLFHDCCGILRETLGYPFLTHIANTAAIRRFPDLQLDMVRLGIGLYGVDPAQPQQSELREVSTLRTTVAQIRKIKAGETVGYNRKGKVSRDSLIATIRIGYADGYPRTLGNGRGSVWIRGQHFPTIGNICMDMTMIDITGADDIIEGTDVIIFGEALSVSRVAEWAGTIPYEILTGISARVRRVYFEE